PKKLVIVGGSYGGYMSMMAVTKAPDVWAAAVPIVPFVNYFTEIQNEDPVLREMDLATMGDPEKNKDLFRDRSPIFFIDQVKARSAKSNYRRAGSAGPRQIRLFLNLLRHGSILAPVGCRNRMNLLRLESHTRAVRVSRAEC